MHLVENVKKVKTPPPSFLMKTYGNSSTKPKNQFISIFTSDICFKLGPDWVQKKISPIDEIIAAKRMQKLIDMNIAWVINKQVSSLRLA